MAKEMKTKRQMMKQAAEMLAKVYENDWHGSAQHDQALGFCDAIAFMFNEDKYDIRVKASVQAEKLIGKR